MFSFLLKLGQLIDADVGCIRSVTDTRPQQSRNCG
jgi:hypothetical protein